MTDDIALIHALRLSGWKVRLGYSKKNFGYADTRTRILMINPISLIAGTITHELLHIKNPSLSEEAVALCEKILIRNMAYDEEFGLVKALDTPLAEYLSRRLR